MIPSREEAPQLRRGVVEACVLGLLSQEPMYGWQLADRLIDEGRIIGSIGTLYPVLTRLRARQDVTTYDRPSTSGPPRRYYRLTEAGEQRLDSFRRDWAGFAEAVSKHVAVKDF